MLQYAIASRNPAPAKSSTFRLVVQTQYMENYGAHDWNGKGECPQYWKYKGGYEYHILEGLSAQQVVELSLSLGRVIARHSSIFTHADDYSREYVIDVSFYHTNEETPQEKEHREMLAEGYINASDEVYYRPKKVGMLVPI